MRDYHSTHMAPYEPENDRRGFTQLVVLPELTGKPWDEVALAYVHALRPTSIRVTRGECKTDARTWRVTVAVDEDDLITKIHQEVEVWLPAGVAHGSALDQARDHGLNSPEVRWHEDATGYTYSSGVFKSVQQPAEGRSLYPSPHTLRQAVQTWLLRMAGQGMFDVDGQLRNNNAYDITQLLLHESLVVADGLMDHCVIEAANATELERQVIETEIHWQLPGLRPLLDPSK